MEVIHDDDNGIILQTTVRGHTIQIGPRLISSIIDVPMLAISASPFSNILEPPSLENLMEIFDAYPQDDEQAHLHIKIGAFSSPHCLLAKIVLHNLWPTTRRSELVLKRARFLYFLVMRMPFSLCKHIMNTMLEMGDEHSIGLPFKCLVTKICLSSVMDIADTEPRVRVQDPLGSQTLMKSNGQLWFEGHDKAPQPPLVQIMEALGSL
jgi:hypothetical protein